MLSPFDDLPIHQIAEPIAYVGTSDRNFYDRYYFNLFERTGAVMLTAGLGVYPNLGVADAFVAATHGDRQHVLRASRELDDRSDTSVGPISIDVLEGLQRLRLRAEDPDGPIELDVTWEAGIPAFLEARHVNRRLARMTTDTARFAQTGSWRGTLRIDGERFDVAPPAWSGGRDRSWGVRPVGEPEPPGRRADGGPGGFLWIYSTMQFDEFTILCILQEDRAGRRSLEQAVRIWPAAAAGREPEPLGQIAHELEFEPGSRRVAAARLRFRPVDGPDLVVDVQTLATSFLSLGTGYGTEPDWRHGMHQGPLAVQHRSFDLSDPDVVARGYGLMDDLGRFELDGAVGHGLFENAVLGPNDRYGFSSR